MVSKATASVISTLLLFCGIFLTACGGNSNSGERNNEQITPSYTLEGRVVDQFGNGLPGINIYYDDTNFVTTNTLGNWAYEGQQNPEFLQPFDSRFDFSPPFIDPSATAENLTFTASVTFQPTALQIIEWFKQQQLENGLLESSENSNVVSLYDNALAAMVFTLNGDLDNAEAIFDFFNDRIDTELSNGVGGFSQFRDRYGIPSNHRWMGDNAWLLIAINNYHKLSGNLQYENLAAAINQWLQTLQDEDGGLYAGYDSNNELLAYKVTEGNIDAYNAVSGYNDFHQNLLNFLKQHRWDENDRNLMAWPDNPSYLYALDNQTWAFCIFEDFPISTIMSTDRFLNTQIATANNVSVTGFDIDEDQDTVFIEGTGQMALALQLAGLYEDGDFYLQEMEKILLTSTYHSAAAGFPYASNRGTGFGTTPLWEGSDTQIALSGGAWYIFAKAIFNPFGAERNKHAPDSDKFWIN